MSTAPRRMCMCAALGITAAYCQGQPPYARVLAANEQGRELIKLISKRSSIPLITKPAAVRELSRECRDVFSLGASAHDFFVLGYTEQRSVSSATSGYFMVKTASVYGKPKKHIEITA